MKKIRLLYLFLILLLFFTTFSSYHVLAQSWDSCPFGLENDPYPGECGRYIDTNQDSICDLSQPKPEDNSTHPDTNTANIMSEQNEQENNIFVSPEEDDYSVEVSGSKLRNMSVKEVAQLWEIDAQQLLTTLQENLLLESDYTINNTINDLRTEVRFSPSIIKMVAEELKKQTIESAPITELSESPVECLPSPIVFPDYNLFEIGLITLFLYLGGKWLANKLKISSAKEKRFWNILLLISFIGSAGTGFILVMIRDLDWFRSIDFNFLFWHVEFSIAMGMIGIFHTLWHVKYYCKNFYKRK